MDFCGRCGQTATPAPASQAGFWEGCSKGPELPEVGHRYDGPGRRGLQPGRAEVTGSIESSPGIRAQPRMERK